MSKTKTYRYLYPSIHFGYGVEFQSTMSDFMKKASGLIVNMFIGDVNQVDTPFSIFILFDKSKAKNFDVLLNWFNKQQCFVFDYEVDDRYHMVVAQVPDEYTETYRNFRNSKYSKMYSQEFLNKYLNTSATKETYGVLAKTEERAKFLRDWIQQEQLADEYDSIIDDRETFDRTTYDYK